MTTNDPKTISKLLRAMAASEDAKTHQHDVILNVAADFVDELDRVRNIPQTGNRGHLKPVILDAKGEAIAPPPISHQLQLDRKVQYALDRFDCMMSLDTDQFRIFSLRWGLVPPPGGWENRELIINTMHTIRVGLPEIPYMEKHKSAMHMVANNLKLPPGIYFEDGELKGVQNA